MLRLQAFGGLHLAQDGVRVAGGAAQRKRLAVLVVLATHRRTGISREKLAALFWPESDRSRSRNALYQVVAAIRRDLGNDVVSAGSTGDLTLNSDRITSDVADFRDAIASRDPERAVAVYAGPFLDGVYLRGSDEFERWSDEMRSACITDYCGALRDLARRDSDAGDHSGATRWLRRLAVVDTMSASVALQLMGALVASGEREAAMRHGREHIAYVRAELGSAPDPRISALLGELQTAPAATEPPYTSSATLPQSTRENANRDLRRDAAADVAPQTTEVDRASTERLGLPVESVLGAVRSRWRPSRRAFAIAGAVVASALAIVAFVRPSPTAADSLPAIDPRRVVVADFVNLTSDSTLNLLGSTLADWVTRGVLESGLTTVFDPVSRIAVLDARKAARPEGGDDATTLALAAGAGLVVTGAIARQGEQLVITARIIAYPSHCVVFSLDPILAPVSDPLGQANELRDRIAGALAVAVDRRVASITLPSSRTPTYAAYQQFVLGLQRFSSDEKGALAFFEQASALDTTFALPLIWASFAYGNHWRFAQRDSVIDLLRRRPPPPGSLEALHLQWLLAKDPAEKLEITLRGVARSPGSTWSMHAGQELHDRNRMREAITYFEQVDVEHSWARGWPTFWLYYSRTLHAIGEYDKEYRISHRGLAIEPDGPGLRSIEIRALAGLGRSADVRERMLALMTLLESSGCAESGELYEHAALESQAHGDIAAAGIAMRSWIPLCQRELAEPADSLTPRRQLSLGKALYRADLLDSAQRVLARVSGRLADNAVGELQVHGRLGRIAARRGDRAGAERQMRELLTHQGRVQHIAAMEYAAIASLLGEQVLAFRVLESALTVLPYAHFHRDPDYANLWSYPPFVALATPR